ncbi:M20 family metallopeptidase [bacterium]|jgi:acetylornithine deacetylase ArgE|nr:M20 family metallopeptidase [bacterium]
MQPSRALSIAQSLIQIPSVNPSFDPTSKGESDVAFWLTKWGEAHGFETTTQPVTDKRSNVLISLTNGSDRPHLLLNGHMDTVGVGGMTIDPFAATVAGGRLYGRGASDMKGPLACMLTALLDLRDQPAQWTGKVTVAAVVDEEFCFIGVQRLLKDQPAIDFAIVGEPTRLEVIRGCKGCLRFQVTTRGRAAHSSRPKDGASAISAMARVIPALETYFEETLSQITEPDFGPSTGSIGLIHGGIGVNIVPDQCEIQVDVRLLPSQQGDQVHREIIDIVKHVPLPQGTSCSVSQPVLNDPGYAIPADSPFVRTMVETLGRDLSGVVAFSCDASKIARSGIPCVIMGPGDIRSAHTIDESITLEDLQAGAIAYARIARALLAS